MVGDDPVADVAAAQRVGLRGVLVLSGKTIGGASVARARPARRAVAADRTRVAADAGRRRRRARLTATFPRPRPATRAHPPMTTDSAPRIKITYATLSADNEELHAGFEAAVVATPGDASAATTRTTSTARGATATGRSRSRSPIDRDIAARDVRARRPRPTSTTRSPPRARAQPAWAAVPWRERLAIIRRAGDLISDRLMEYSADMAIEVGKNRIEALGEVEESADLLRYYAQTMEDNDGYDHPMGNLGDATVHTRSILRPHGVFAVISPFNFPMALATRSDRRRAAGRQHGRPQAVDGVAAVGGQPHRGLHRCRRPEGRRSTS